MSQYVLGFMFDSSGQYVALIKKLKPAWQKGKLNGIGGKVESGETIDQAMVREFEEESGVRYENWKYLGIIRESSSWAVHIFGAVSDDVFEVRTAEEEEIILTNLSLNGVDFFGNNNFVGNLKWLVPFAYDRLMNPNGPRVLEVTY